MLVNQDGGGIKFLTNTDAFGLTHKGVPLAVYALDTKHVLLRSVERGRRRSIW